MIFDLGSPKFLVIFFHSSLSWAFVCHLVIGMRAALMSSSVDSAHRTGGRLGVSGGTIQTTVYVVLLFEQKFEALRSKGERS